jgi:hypothetical protein
MFDWPARIKTLSGLPCARAIVGEQQQTKANNVGRIKSGFIIFGVVMERSL